MTYSKIIYILYCGLNIIYVIVLGLYIYIYTPICLVVIILGGYLYLYIYMIYDYDIYIYVYIHMVGFIKPQISLGENHLEEPQSYHRRRQVGLFLAHMGGSLPQPRDGTEVLAGAKMALEIMKHN